MSVKSFVAIGWQIVERKNIEFVVVERSGDPWRIRSFRTGTREKAEAFIEKRRAWLEGKIVDLLKESFPCP